ncbi:LysR family transcriptional regulator ArgP [Cryobacterium tagatosivorans]|uniref:LysR family transcriptional regulator ArgP n=1 Tax=Cryobacterium tagatosivorans TaxID=1259199 RepID=A0A4V6QG32_9MICO|nr:LysR family transcriptional regulator ArgP [Cryobacterium tagatosivorans]TFB52815.1 LysR family transcriptional regulator ArgP [Cryobacterium tagatosivorans]
MPSYSLEHLRTLVAVLDEGTFDAAAARLHVTASAVSQRIKAMEEATGQVLVQRTNPARATAAGVGVARYARQVDLLGEDLRRELGEDGREKATYSIAVAVNADSLATWFLPALATAHERFGAIFDVHRDDEEYTVALLRSGTVMAAVTATEQAVQGCTSSLLGVMRYRAVAAPTFLSRWSPRADLSDLDRMPVVDFDRKDELQRGFVRTVLGREPSGPRHLIPTSDDFARSILLGLGWGLLPEQQAGAHLNAGSLVELAPQHPIDVRLYWQRWNLASPQLDGLTRVVREAATATLRQA